MVPGWLNREADQPGRAEGHPGIRPGADRLAPAGGARQPPRLRHPFGAPGPARAVGAAIVTPSANGEAMAEHPRVIGAAVASGGHAVPVCDDAGWHQPGERLAVPDNVTLPPPSPHTPELNPMEKVRDCPRGSKLAHAVWDGCEAIVDACANAWLFLVNDPDRIRFIAQWDWAAVNRHLAKTCFS